MSAQLGSKRDTKLPMLELHSRLRTMKISARNKAENEADQLKHLQQQFSSTMTKFNILANQINSGNKETHSRIDRLHSKLINQTQHAQYDKALQVFDLTNTAPKETTLSKKPSPIPKRNSNLAKLIQPTMNSSSSSSSSSSNLHAINASPLSSLSSLSFSSAPPMSSTFNNKYVLSPIKKLASKEQQDDIYKKFPHDAKGKGSRKTVGNYYTKVVNDLAKQKIYVTRPDVMNWISERRPSTKKKVAGQKRGRPTLKPTAEIIAAAINSGADRINNGGHAPSGQEIGQHVQTQMNRAAQRDGVPSRLLTLKEHRELDLIVDLNTVTVANPDDNCQTIPRYKAGDVRNAISQWAVRHVLTCCQRLGCTEEESAANNIHPIGIITHDETTDVVLAGHGGTYNLKVPLKNRKDKITAKRKSGHHLPGRFVLLAVTDASGGCDQMVTYNMKDYDKFRKEGSNGVVADPNQNIFKIEVFGGSGKPRLQVRFVRPGTPEKEYTKDSFRHFVLQQVENRRISISEAIGVEYDPENIDPITQSTTIGSDGAGGNLAATAKYVLDGEGDKKYESFSKSTASGTHYQAECDVMSCFRDHKRVMRHLLRLYDEEASTDSPLQILDDDDDEVELEDFQLPVETVDFWKNHQQHQTYIDVMNAVSGSNSTLGFTMRKARLLARYCFVLVVTRGSTFSSQKVMKSYAVTGTYPNDAKRAITNAPQWKNKAELSSQLRRHILKPDTLQSYLQEVKTNDKVGDTWFDSPERLVLFPVSRYGKDQYGNRINRDNYKISRQTSRILSSGKLRDDIKAKEKAVSDALIAEAAAEQKKNETNAKTLEESNRKATVLLEEIRLAGGCDNIVPKSKAYVTPIRNVLRYLKLNVLGARPVIQKRVDSYLIEQHGAGYGLVEAADAELLFGMNF